MITALKFDKTTLKNIAISVLPVAVVAILGSVFVTLGQDWFASTNKPLQWLPDFVIPIVWTVVYVLYAIAIFRWKADGQITKPLAILLVTNGVLNVAWCLFFFTLHLTLLGEITIALNLVAAVLLAVETKRNQLKMADILLIYPTWLVIAMALNSAIWILN